MIESEWRSPTRSATGAVSTPRTRIVVGCVVSSPCWVVSAARAFAGRRSFAALTPLCSWR
jgi:hypothetical protein